MPRKIHSPGTVTPRQHSQLVDELARELKTVRESGQPFIDEEHFETNAIRVVVLWDRWAEIPEDDRFDVIFNAYRTAEGETYANRIGLASGLTIPEAYASGMLPFQIVTGMRRGDSVTFDQCRRAMIEQGASTLLDPAWPQLRFATKEDAEACCRRLVARLPGSELIWLVADDTGRIITPLWPSEKTP